MKTIKINVTADHIAKGQRQSDEFCPIALAIRDAGWDAPRVSGTDVIYYDEYGESLCGLLPEAAQYFVHGFDSGEPVEPFEFDLIEITYEEWTNNNA